MSVSPIILYSQDAPTNVSAPANTNQAWGQAFQPSHSADIVACQFRLVRTADVTGMAVCQIFDATIAGGLIIGSGAPKVQSDPVDLSTVPTTVNGALISFPFSTPFTLQSNRVYVAVMLVTAFSGGQLTVLGVSPLPPGVLNGSEFFPPLSWFAFADHAFSLIVFGSTPTGNVVLTVRTLYGDGSAAAPVTVHVANPALAVSLTQTSTFGLHGDILTFTVPTGTGYVITLDYADCTGARQTATGGPIALFSDVCVVTGGGPFPPPLNVCLSLPGLTVFRTAPGLGADIDLVKWKARPDFHHFSLSKDGPIDTIFALVGNRGTETECVTLQFAVVLPNGSLLNFFGLTNFVTSLAEVTDFARLAPDQDREIALSFAPSMLGRYSVTVTALWDVSLPNPRASSNSKTIQFDVVP